MKNKNLFVYFTSDNLATVANNNKDKLTIRAISFGINNPYYLYPQNENKSELTELHSFPDALLIYDGLELYNVQEQYHLNIIAQLKELKNNYEKIYVCYHDRGSISTANYLEFKDCFHALKEGHHRTNNHLYLTAINFINKDYNAVQKALNAFDGDPELRKKLNILHNCLTLEGVNKFENEQLEDFTEEEKAAFSTFKSCIGNIEDPIDESYFRCLERLRNEWLKGYEIGSLND